MALFGVLLTYMGVMTSDTSKGISRLVKDISVPCLLFSRVGGSISIANLIRWLPVPVYALTNTLFGCFIGYGVALIGGLPPEIRRFTMVSVGFANTNTIPLAFMQTLSHQEPGLLSYEGEGPHMINDRGQTFILMFSLTITFLRWTLADSMLEYKDGDTIPPSPAARPKSLKNVKVITQNDLPYHEINNPIEIAPPPTFFTHVKEISCKVLEFFPVPLWACIFAVVIGISPARDFFFDSHRYAVPPLHFFTTAISGIGATVTPLMNIVLGSKLLKGPTKGKVNLTLILLISWLKLVMLPVLFGIGLTYFIGYYVTSWIQDPTMLFVLLLESANPPALLLLMMCTSNDFMVEEMTTLVFYSYMFSVVSLTVFSFGFLLLL